MKWRYQPVWKDDVDGKPFYSIIEVYFDANDELEGWTDPECCPAGETGDELARDLALMIGDCWGWEPVRYTDLKVGMQFHRRLSADDRKLAAKLLKAMAENFGIIADEPEGSDR